MNRWLNEGEKKGRKERKEKEARERGNYFIPRSTGRSNHRVTTLPNKTTNFNHYNTELSFKIKFSFKPQRLLLDILELILRKF